MVKVAIVGTGGIGRTHLESIKGIPFATVTDLCDPNPAAEETAREFSAAYHTGLDEMLARSEADVVLLCTPTFLHFTQAAAVLRSGRYCVSEKPLCLSSKEARELYALAKGKGVFLYVAQVLRFWEEYGRLAEAVRGGAYGPVRDAYFYRLTQRPEWISGGWLFDRKKSGLIPFDLHIHELDLMVSLFGKPVSFSVQKGRGEGSLSYDEYYRISYGFANRTTACAEASWYNVPVPFRQGYRVYFQRAMMEYDGKDVTLYERDAPPRRLEADDGPPVATGINVGPTTAFRREMIHFLTCVQEGRASHLIREEEVVAVLETLEAIQGQA